MKKLGLIGGYSYKSTIYYYDKIVYAFQGECDITLRSIDYTIFDHFANAGDLDGLALFLQEAVNDLLRVGCEVIAIACNTAHIVIDKLDFKGAVFVDIVSSIADFLAKEGISSALIFGTKITVTTNFMKEAFKKKEIILIPADDEPHSSIIESVLSDYCGSQGMEPTSDMVKDITNSILVMLNCHKVEAFIFGCTEMPLICDGRQFEKSVDAKYLSSSDVHIDCIIEAMKQLSHKHK